MVYKNDIIIFGPPGSGKGTQAYLLSKLLDCIVLECGAMLRRVVTQQEKGYEEINTFISNGKLVPDHVVIALIERTLVQINGRVIFDGFPRTLLQAEALDRMLLQYKRKVDIVFQFTIDNDELLYNRLTQRVSCLNCGTIYNLSAGGTCTSCGIENFIQRKDDSKIAAILKRISEYRLHEKNLLQYYKNKVISINADKDIQVISKEIELLCVDRQRVDC